MLPAFTEAAYSAASSAEVLAFAATANAITDISVIIFFIFESFRLLGNFAIKQAGS